MQQKILLMGGSGLIGSQIQAILRNNIPSIQLFVGGRKNTSENHLKVDVNNPDTFDSILKEGINLIVLCTSDRQNNILKFCIKHKLDYIDITKPSEDLKKAYELAKIEKIESRIVFSSGWMGGIIPSLAFYNGSLSPTEYINIYVYYSLKDKAGKSSADFMAENVSKKFPIYRNNALVLVRHFEDAEQYNFIFNTQNYRLYNFDIPDIYILNKIENIPNISAKITYSSSIVTRGLAVMQKLDIFKHLSLNIKKKLFYSSGKGDQTAFEIVTKQSKGYSSRISLVSANGQAYLTAYATYLHIEKIINGQLANQTYFSYQLYKEDELINNLKKNKQIKIK